MKSIFILTISLVLIISCKVEESPINYGQDACKFCKMTIVDKQHAAEIVTKKGKPFKYDAIECMVRDENLPSPMGANLTGFKNKEQAELVIKEKNGTLYTWTELKELFSK